MASKFAGFKPETFEKKILPALGYDGPTDMKSINLFLAANPAAAAKMGRYTMAARQMVEGEPIKANKGVDTGAEEKPAVESFEEAKTKQIANPDKYGSPITEVDVKGFTKAEQKAGMIDKDVGKAKDTKDIKATVAKTAEDVKVPKKTKVQTVETKKSIDDVKEDLKDLKAEQGEITEDDLVDAAQGDPERLAQLRLEAAQIDEAVQVEDVPELKLRSDELVSGPTVDQARVEKALDQEQAFTVKDELSSLMADFEGGDTPAWAAGAMRNAMAGMAAVQAAMESALPIAQMDAANKQQMAMAKAEQRAKFLGMEFDQAFQTKVKNAARIAEVANMNFTAEQQVAIENARLANSVDLANLDAANAKILADAAAMTQMDMANLNNRQQAAVQNAQAFLEMNMANLDNKQQTSIFKAQARANALMSDASEENANRQFNATSKMQTDQFFAQLAVNVSKHNNEQKNAMSRFNAGEKNAMSRFNTQERNDRHEFNKTQQLVIAQANAEWAQKVTTTYNAEVNAANREDAKAMNNMTQSAYDASVQRTRDFLAWAWTSGENAKENDANVMIANISANKKADDGGFLSNALDNFIEAISSNASDYIFKEYFDFE